MHDETSIPPLRNLPPGRLDAVKQHLMAEIAADARPRRRPTFSIAARRLTVVSVGAMLAVAGAAALVLMTQSQVPRSTTSSHSHSGVPPAYQPLTVNLSPGAQGVSSVNVAVDSPVSGASLQVQVLRSNASLPEQAMQESPANQQVVYQEQVPMTDVASPASGAPGTVALATWSGVLSPADWIGGCQNALYRVVAEIAAPSGTYSSFSAPAYTFSGQWFNCSTG